MGSVTYSGKFLTCQLSWSGTSLYVGDTITAKITGSLSYEAGELAYSESFTLRSGASYSSNVVKTIGSGDSRTGKPSVSETVTFTIDSVGTYYLFSSWAKYSVDDDGDWHQSGSGRSNTSNTSITVLAATTPTAPEKIVVPELHSKETATISWSKSTTADGKAITYVLERQLDGGAWAQVYSGAATSADIVIPESVKVAAFRVYAKTAYVASGYTTSETVAIKSSAVAMQTTVAGVAREVDMLLAGVDGVSREVDSTAVGINGVTVL